MKTCRWIIVGATSIIAQEFSHLAAQAGHSLLLVGRNQSQLIVLAADIHLRYQVDCKILVVNLTNDISDLLKEIQCSQEETNLFLCHSLMLNNEELNEINIPELIQSNIVSTIQLIHAYLHTQQTEHRLLFISSVAAVRGRAKNSLYGASKATIEIYLQGLQQAGKKKQHITIARLGFIDTHQTYGEPGIFYASPPKSCAAACWRATSAGKRQFYHPFFWRYIMTIIVNLPFFLYKKIRQ